MFERSLLHSIMYNKCISITSIELATSHSSEAIDVLPTARRFRFIIRCVPYIELNKFLTGVKKHVFVSKASRIKCQSQEYPSILVAAYFIYNIKSGTDKNIKFF